jgi:hypothetical protein
LEFGGGRDLSKLLQTPFGLNLNIMNVDQFLYWKTPKNT